MDTSRQRNRFDPTQMSFPTDVVTFEQIRKREPDAVSWRSTPEPDALLEVVAVHGFEFRLAEKAFCRARSMPDPYPQNPREDLIEALCEGYRSLNLSGGKHQSTQLAREIEVSAERIAMQGGKSGGR